MPNGSSSMTKYLCISSYIRKPLLIYDFAPNPIWISLYMRKIFFYFLSVWYSEYAHKEAEGNLIYFPISSSPCLFYIGQCNNNCKLLIFFYASQYKKVAEKCGMPEKRMHSAESSNWRLSKGTKTNAINQTNFSTTKLTKQKQKRIFNHDCVG